MLLLRVRMRVVMAMMVSALLLCLLRSHAHLFLGLSLDVFNEFRDSHAILLSVDSKLALHCLDLLGSWSLSRLGHGNLTRPRLRATLRWWGRHFELSVDKRSKERREKIILKQASRKKKGR